MVRQQPTANRQQPTDGRYGLANLSAESDAVTDCSLSPVRCYLSLGSNLGDRNANLLNALAKISELPQTSIQAVSSFLNTKPVGVENQPDFLNAVVRMHTALEPLVLLKALQAIETDLGRVRGVRWGPRTVDLDILYYGDLSMKDISLVIPHPEIPNRPFLQPLLSEVGYH